MTDEDKLDDAVQTMVAVLGQMSDAQEHMLCLEANAIADVIRFSGAADAEAAADQFIEHHAYGDDGGGDEHHDMWHDLTYEPVPCRECGHDESDDEIERRKDGS